MKDTVTLDFSSVDPKIHNTFVAHAISLGYSVFADKVENVTDSSNRLQTTIPTLHDFEVPEGSNIDSAGEAAFRLGYYSEYCKENLTNKNFACRLPKGLVRGGFLPMERDFESSDAITAIKDLALKTGRNFRVGTALELLLFWKKNRSICPKYFVALGTIWNDEVLCWNDHYAEFGLFPWDDEWDEYHEVFFVEDLESSSSES